MNWYAIYTKPKAEGSVAQLLSKAGIETLNPKINVRKYAGRKYIEAVEQLFPCYIFAFFDEGKQGHMVRYMRGVKFVVGKKNPLTVHPRQYRSYGTGWRGTSFCRHQRNSTAAKESR
jgi:transcriptional antiterminator RfaH